MAVTRVRPGFLGRIEQTQLSYVVRHARHDVWLGPGWGAALCVLFSGLVPEVGAVAVADLATWWLVMLLWAIALVAVLRCLRDRLETGRSEAACVTAFVCLYGFNGAIWGAFIWMAWEPGNFQNHLFCSLIVLGLGITLVGQQSPHLKIFLASAIPPFGTLAICYLIEGDTTHLSIFVVTVLFGLFMGTIGLRANRILRNSLVLGFENSDLANHLRQARDEATMAVEQLDIQRLRAEEASRAKSRFLASMSHELRTPLNAIIGFSEAMKLGVFGPVTPPRYAEYANDINASAVHLLNIISDILDLSKVEAGRQTLNDTQIDGAAFLDATAKLMSDQAKRRDVELSVSPPLPNVLIVADEVKLRQILLNLLSNAIKFCAPGGGVRLEAETSPDGSLVISVRDDGAGIPPEDLAEVLSPFVQLGDPTDARQQGTGLGLPIAKALAELHGGSLELRSELGVGTTVRINLPAARVRALAESKAS